MNKYVIVAAVLGWLATTGVAREIVPGPIQTPWDSHVDPANVLPEYPRPQLVRKEWRNLNGKWDYAITATGAARPVGWEGKILVPFCFESELSGVNRIIKPEEWMWYHRTFEVSKDWKSRRIWLNFEASDWETVVYVNGKEIGTHRHGYTPFSFDVTDALKAAGPQELVVRVWDHSSTKLFSSAGKQGSKQDVYECCSGIWQTVWLEPRSAGAIVSLKIKGSLKKAAVSVAVETDDKAPAGTQAKVEVLAGGNVVAEETGALGSLLTVRIPNPKAWEPNSPFLYDLRVTLINAGKTIDSIKSYCGLRDIWIDKSLKGPQLVLNGKAFFHFGPLDQGYWPLSVFTPPTEEALVYELDYLKSIGCNMVRLHIKKNPARWYYHCDRLGLMVWQDFICSKTIKNPDSDASELWKKEQVMLMDSLKNHPSVVKWIVFNESWGQHDTEANVKWAKGLLPDHIVSCASGWTDYDNLGDIRDIHDYSRFPSTTMPQSEPNRVVVLGETGGFGVPVNGNNWLEMPEPHDPGTPDGRVTSNDRKGGMNPVNGCADNDFISDIKRPVYTVEGQVSHYARYIETMHLEQAYGLSGAIYTQLTDMRHEQNGWLTFDRKVSKIPVVQMKAIHEMLYQPVPGRSPLVMRGSLWKSSDGKTVALPFTPKKPFTKTPVAKGGKKKKGKKAGGPMVAQTVTTAYRTEFEVKQRPQRAAVNIFMDSDHDSDVWNYLRIFLDGELIFDDMSRHKKPEYRVTCVPLTDAQCAKLTLGKHELSFELENRIPIKSLDISLDAVEGKMPWQPAVSVKRKSVASKGELIWSYITAKPVAGWEKSGFDDSGWESGPGGFGSKGLKTMRVRTKWDGSDIWLRRSFELDKLPERPALRIFHDEDAEVYLNGVLVKKLKKFTKDYILLPINPANLKTGTNLLAIHCKQQRGGQYIDAVVVDGTKPPKAVAKQPSPDQKTVRVQEGAGANMPTPWTAGVTPGNVLPEHPEPMFERADWLSLNGLWDYAIEPSGFAAIQGFVKKASLTVGSKPAKWDGKLLVPFAVDAPLSRVGHILRPEERIWYERTFSLPANMRGKRIHLHFQASDWETSVYLNGQRIGQHRGGYDPFLFEITGSLVDGANLLTVCVWDGTEQQGQPLGKQIMPENRKGFRYQPTGGIWQPVWLEAVPQTHLTSVSIVTDLTGLTVHPKAEGDGKVKVTVKDGGKTVAEQTGLANGSIRLDVPSPKLWSPDSPHLYQLELALVQNGKIIDQVKSHAGLRTVKVGKQGEILLNGKPAVMFGPLDQGYWPDGVLTPPCDEAIVYDLQYLKDIGCNMVRVHIKTHPARWYYHADRLGLLVIQDMICTPKYGQTVTPEVSANWRREFGEMIRDFGNHPSIISWCVFNEAWGQHDTVKMTEWAQRTDPSRLILSTSGWMDHGAGDILDVHDYSTYPTLPLENANRRAITFGEVGGHNLLLEAHKWHPDQTQSPGVPLTVSGGRMNFDSIQDMDAKYDFYFRNLRHFAARAGCRSFVYTQITDVEHECNGFMTYDRKFSKLPKERFREIHNQLFTTPEYTPLTVSKGWKKQVAPALPGGGKKKKKGQPDLAPAWAKLKGPWNEAGLPYDSDAPILTGQQKPMLALKQSFDVAAAPRRAVLEIRFRNPSWNTDVPPEKLDGHLGRKMVLTRVGVFIDGKLFRDHKMKVHAGHGKCVSFLELTDEEAATLAAGSHEIGLIFPDATDLHTLDIALLTYK